MSALRTSRRITVYAVEVREKRLIEDLLKLGSKGDKFTEAGGMGEHASIDDPFAHSPQVRIERFVLPEVAEKIMDYIRGMTVSHLPVAACAECVDARRRDHF